MRKFTAIRINLFALALAVAAGWGVAAPTPTLGQEERGADFKDADSKVQFLRLCDIACKELNKELTPFGSRRDVPSGLRDNADPRTHHMPFFEDAHAVRAIAVAYDVTGKKEYLDTCKLWSDRMIAYQEKMIPKGAYYMNYLREPGRTDGLWLISDSASVGMAVLATAVRCTDKAAKQRYLNSVEAFAELVMADRIGKGGGIIEDWTGTWKKDEWWCSTATFGAMTLHLYEETGKEKYRKVGLGAMGWMVGRDYRTAEFITIQDRPSGVIYYDFQLYVAGMKYLKAGSEEREAAMAQIATAVKWMAENQKGRGAKVPWNYDKSDDEGCHVDMTGLPFLMYAFAHQLPEYRYLAPEADRELRYIGNLLFEKGNPPVTQLITWELVTWGMMSYAEKLSPGALFRTSDNRRRFW